MFAGVVQTCARTQAGFEHDAGATLRPEDHERFPYAFRCLSMSRLARLYIFLQRMRPSVTYLGEIRQYVVPCDLPPTRYALNGTDWFEVSGQPKAARSGPVAQSAGVGATGAGMSADAHR